jgi:DTW domain-containing protein
VRFGDDARVREVCASGDAALLFPGANAADPRDLAKPPGTLVVVDGTWSQARKVVRENPLLQALPRVALRPEKPGNYRIRKEPEAHCVSTIEAVAYVLEHLERAPGRFTPILKAFDHMVDRQLDYIQATGNQSRHQRKKVRNSVKVDPAAELKAKAGSLVVVFGEANAWPLDAPERPLPDEPELIQLVGLRLATGETFEALLQPKRPLSPSVPFHLDLPAEALATAEERGAALARWQGFLRDDDLLVGWGHFCAALLQQEGLAARPFLDLRAVLAQCSSRRPGSVETCAGLLAVPLPNGKGRAARRLVALSAVSAATVRGQMQALLERPRARRRGQEA